MLGLEFVKGPGQEPSADEAKQLAAYCLDKGLLILVWGSYGNIVRVPAPFVITDEQLDKGLAIMEAGLAAIPIDPIILLQLLPTILKRLKAAMISIFQTASAPNYHDTMKGISYASWQFEQGFEAELQ